MTDVRNSDRAGGDRAEDDLPDLSPVLHGHGLRLRSWDDASDGDVDAWLRGLTDPDFRRWNTPVKSVSDRESARESLRWKLAAVADGTSASFRITDAASGATLGHIGVNEIDLFLRTARVGYWILPEARGQGVATRALALAARWALTDLGVHRLELGHAVGHAASCRIAERCGFLVEGTLRGAMHDEAPPGGFRDVHLHARVATDPDPALP
ncbi:GNAT family N-acetyltransferase [Streptomyces sp. NPDC048664]|uniref:GNAT family N-acetyltransferase n=1 Tax=Streptomyces sp. NPDC048664 TaxID=3154505 RepID=UPI003449CA89